MGSAIPSAAVFQFGRFEANVTRNTLMRDGVRIRIHDQPFRVLILLLERPAEIVTREELRQKLWPEGTYVDFDGSLNVILKKLRAALQDDAENPRFIETVPRQGYRFIAPVTVQGAIPPPAAVTESKLQTSPSKNAAHPAAALGSRVPVLRYAFRLAIASALVVTGWLLWHKKEYLANAFDISLKAKAHISVRRSVAVLGFHNASGRNDDAWLSTAFSEMLSTELAGGDKLRLVSGEDVVNLRISSPWPQTDSLDRATAAHVGTALNSDLLVLGSYTSIGQADSGELRLDVRLQDARTGEILTEIAQTGDRQDMFRFVSNVGTKLRKKLGLPQLQDPEQTSVVASMPINRDAARFYALGVAKLRDFDALAARDLLEQACKADPKFALGHVMLARAWNQLGYEQKRKEEAKKALDLSGALPAAERLQVEGDYYESLADHEKAASSYHALFELFPDSVEYGLQLALAQRAAGHRVQAVETLHQLRRLPGSASDDPRIDLSESRAMPDNKPAALLLIRSAMHKATVQGKRLVYAQAKKEECMDLIYGDNPDAGVPACEEAEQIYLGAGNRLDAADAVRLIADRQGSQGHLEQAIATYQHALDILQGLSEHLKTGAILNNMATDFQSEGNIDRAEQLYRQALSHFEEGGEKYDSVAALSNLGDVAFQRGNLKEAARIYQQTLDRIAQLDHGAPWYVLYRLADLKLAQGAMADAHRLAQHAIDSIQPMEGGYGDLTGAMTTLGEILEAEGDMAGARQQQEQALALRKKIGSMVLIGETQVALADLALCEAHSQEAEQLLREAVTEFEKEKSDPDTISGLTLTSRALLMDGKADEARKAIQRATDLDRNNPDPALKLPIAIQTARVEIAEAASNATGPNVLNRARQRLQSTVATAKHLGYYMLECEARLVLGQLEMKAMPPQGRVRLAALALEARSHGLQLLSQQAEQAARTASSTLAANNPVR